jgi:hypothetical protein
MVASSVAVGQMGHDFKNQQVGSIHHVPGAAIAERANELFKYAEMKLHGALSRNIRLGE